MGKPLSNLRTLMGDVWVDDLIAAPLGPGTHDLAYALQSPSDAWVRWREMFDRAIGLVLPLLEPSSDGRDRQKVLRRKLEDDLQYQSTVPEVLWAGRLRSLGWAVGVEPLAKGPDLSFAEAGLAGFVEVYSPEFRAEPFRFLRILEHRLQREEGSFHVSIEVPPPNRKPHVMEQVIAPIKKVLGQLRAEPLKARVRLAVRDGGAWSVETLEEYRPLTRDSFNPPLIAAIDVRGTDVGSMTFGAHTGAGPVDIRSQMGEVLSGLKQLQRGAPNVLVIDGTRDFMHDDELTAAAKRRGGAFDRHPELSAIVVSRMGVYIMEPGEELVDEHFVVENAGAAIPLTTTMLDALGRSGLLL